MSKKTIDDIDVRGKRVLARLDLNVPLNPDRQITDDGRIVAALPTVKKLLGDGAQLILMTHLGRPKGAPETDGKFGLSPVAKRLEKLLNQPVGYCGDSIGDRVRAMVDDLTDGQCCLLENLRFNRAETIKDKEAARDASLRKAKDAFAASLAGLADVYVNDAFGTCHRDNASMLTVPQQMTGKDRVMGYLVARELKFLGQAVSDPKRPFVAILGGAKVSDKLNVIDSLLEKCDAVLIGGAMAYTFAAADGIAIGRSLVEPDRFDLVRGLRQKAGDKLRLPVDHVAAMRISSEADRGIFEGAIPDDMMGLDIGPRTVEAFSEALRSAGTIVWNGPMGVFEKPPFDTGTMAIAVAVAEATDRGAISVIGGGDSAAAVQVAGLANRITHVSTGGGASLEFLEGRSFAAIDVLDDA